MPEPTRGERFVKTFELVLSFREALKDADDIGLSSGSAARIESEYRKHTAALAREVDDIWEAVGKLQPLPEPMREGE